MKNYRVELARLVKAVLRDGLRREAADVARAGLHATKAGVERYREIKEQKRRGR